MWFNPSIVILSMALWCIPASGSAIPNPVPVPMPVPAPDSRGTSTLKQATRDQIIARNKRPSKRATPSPTPAPSSVTSDYLNYGLYFSGSGVIETDSNPGNNVAGKNPVTINIPGTTPQNTAIQRCADQTFSLSGVYYQFQIYFDQPTTGNGDGTWICTSYYNGNSNPAYFNVQRATASPVFGYTRSN
ncbi:hypothetical protein I204_04060 [Kwoniella mangroviensis CBS 8886]|uniref:uncharacterized protein n=1 Tax=Kwoniella mangroviensis CBS 8507 TaxID=1296122 RepID=UPI00080D2004|nr:uncharacterized protein I203_05619 [Kwoniella mangroviensis CBS 8507]OCF65370.1 hypothetical protein I203_05619 [Kwoniella mangroviensis CBS 8507]OCF75208.1 hypothetical protein I204_04060 [Kwoniella mangroviensis CBS 8886]